MGRAWAKGCLIGAAFGLVWLVGLIVLYAFAVGEVHDPTRESTSTRLRLSVLLWYAAPILIGTAALVRWQRRRRKHA